VLPPASAIHQLGQAFFPCDGLWQNALTTQIQLLPGGELVRVFADEFLGQLDLGHSERFLSIVPSENNAPRLKPRAEDASGI
jgi:hypothetical protein